MVDGGGVGSVHGKEGKANPEEDVPRCGEPSGGVLDVGDGEMALRGSGEPNDGGGDVELEFSLLRRN